MNRINNKEQRIKPQKGQSLVELALTITILLTLLAGAFDIGNAFLDFVAMRDAAQEGATYASIFPTDTSGIINSVQLSSTQPINFSTFVEDCDENSSNGICIEFASNQCSGNQVTITVRYLYRLIVPFVGGFLGTQDIPLRASVTNEIMTTACE
jgi:Flp pilus assembly protein TadG